MVDDEPFSLETPIGVHIHTQEYAVDPQFRFVGNGYELPGSENAYIYIRRRVPQPPGLLPYLYRRGGVHAH